MPDNDSVFRKPLRTVKWLGFSVLEQHPLARMLHQARAAETAKDTSLPLVQRRSYQIRQQRVFSSRGRGPVDAVAAPPAAEPTPAAPALDDFLLRQRADEITNDPDR
jgi:hypothetical protein